MKINSIKTGIFRENQDLVAFVFKYVKKFPENSILVITSKIVALAEGRTAPYENDKQKIAIIKKEASFAVETKQAWLTIKDGMVMPSAGVDESNGNGKLILLPKDSFVSSERVREAIKKKYKLKNLGVLISDSGIFPLRAGVVGVALGYAGFEGVRDYRGKKDIFGRILKISRVDVGDSLASATVLCMGEGKERKPLALITGAPVRFLKKTNRNELKIQAKTDIFYPMLKKMNEKK
ncbi:MAG: coenzyme F420-0:L-glutamate ligase [Minisyncoccia bacterium]